MIELLEYFPPSREPRAAIAVLHNRSTATKMGETRKEARLVSSWAGSAASGNGGRGEVGDSVEGSHPVARWWPNFVIFLYCAGFAHDFKSLAWGKARSETLMRTIDAISGLPMACCGRRRTRRFPAAIPSSMTGCWQP
jgi:hypothetical protein